MLIDIKTDNDDTYVTDSALHFPPPCNPSRPICTRMWWCRHSACISYAKFSIGFYSVKQKKSNVVMFLILFTKKNYIGRVSKTKGGVVAYEGGGFHVCFA